MSVKEYGKEKLQGLKGKIAAAVKIFAMKAGIIIGGIFLIIIILVSVISSLVTSALGGDDEEGAENWESASEDSWEQFRRYVKGTENSKPAITNVGGKNCYKVELDNGKNGSPVVGYGVDIATHGEEIRKKGYTTNVGDYIPVDLVDNIGDREIKDNFNFVERLCQTENINLTIYQKYALASRCYNYGNVGGTGQATWKYQYPSNLTFAEAYKKYYNQSRDTHYGDYTKTNHEHKLYTQYMKDLMYSNWGPGHPKRRKSEWSLFQTGYFGWASKNGLDYPKDFDEYCILSDISGGTPGKTGKINRGGVEVQTYTSSSKKTYVLYDQTKGNWKNKNWGTSGHTIGQWGCPGASGATILTAMGYPNMTPDQLNTMYDEKVSNVMSRYVKYTKPYECGKLPNTTNAKKDIINWLRTGNPVHFHVIGPNGGGSNRFAYTEHWMALLDVKGSNVYLAPGAGGKPGWYSIDEVTKSLCCYAKVSQK